MQHICPCFTPSRIEFESRARGHALTDFYVERAKAHCCFCTLFMMNSVSERTHIHSP